MARMLTPDLSNCSFRIFINRLQLELSNGEKLHSKILIITGSGETASQYMSYMSVFFTAQRQNILIDVCSLDQDLSLLQQGCDITGGLYLKVPQLSALVQYLLVMQIPQNFSVLWWKIIWNVSNLFTTPLFWQWVFLPEPPLRNCLVLPPPVKVDYRAACFCHQDLIDTGFVCSVCLSSKGPVRQCSSTLLKLHLCQFEFS